MGGGVSCGFHSNDCVQGVVQVYIEHWKIINYPFHKVHPLNLKYI